MSVKQLAVKLKDTFLDLLFPPRCINCGRGGAYICERCRGMLFTIESSVCDGCGMPLAPGVLCTGCSHNLSHIDGIYSLYSFGGVARKAVHRLKYNNLRVLSGMMAQLLSGYMRQSKLACDALVPVPLHKSRLRERGYNQSLLLCRKLGQLCGIPVDSKSLLRSRRTASQTECDREGRISNVYGAFECADGTLNGRNVVLIDDVCTTGATLEACAEALKKRGVFSVYGLTFARDA